MTKTTVTLKSKKTRWMAWGAGLLVLPMALTFGMPATAKADDFRISLNLGGAPYYSAPQRVVYHAPAPQRVVYVKEPRRVVYHSRPVYRERVVYVDKHHGRGNGRGHGRWDDRGHRVAWR